MLRNIRWYRIEMIPLLILALPGGFSASWAAGPEASGARAIGLTWRCPALTGAVADGTRIEASLDLATAALSAPDLLKAMQAQASLGADALPVDAIDGCLRSLHNDVLAEARRICPAPNERPGFVEKLKFWKRRRPVAPVAVAGPVDPICGEPNPLSLAIRRWSADAVSDYRARVTDAIDARREPPAPVAIPLTWSCPQSFARPGVAAFAPAANTALQLKPAFRKIPDQVDVSEWLNVLVQAERQHPEIDYHECFTDQLNQLTASLTHARVAPKLIENLTALMRDQLVEYGKRAETRGARPPMLPMGQAPQGAAPASASADQLCADASRGFAGAASTYLDGTFVRDRLPGLIRSATRDCRGKVVKAYAAAVADRQLPKARCTASAANCAAVVAGSRSLLSALSGLTLLNLERGLSPLGTSESCVAQGEAISAGLRDPWMQGLLSQCAPMLEGESTVVTSSKSSVDGHYVLRRLPGAAGAPKFEATVNYEFVGSGEGGAVAGSALSEAEERDIRSRTERCFAVMEPYLSGPNGEKLALRLAPRGDAEHAQIRQFVSFTPKVLRQHWTKWGHEVGCPTILHETLHHLGLVDEYKERLIGRIKDANGNWIETEDKAELASYDCRLPGPKDSVMADQWEAIKKSAETSEGADVVLCRCVGDGSGWTPAMSRCRDALAEIREAPVKCPAATSEVVDTGIRMSRLLAEMDPFQRKLIDETLERYGSGKLVGSLEYRFIRPRAARGAPRSVLLPAHFRAITRPSCEPENRLYYACSQDAYLTSKVNQGLEPRTAENLRKGCRADIPAECSDPNRWLQ